MPDGVTSFARIEGSRGPARHAVGTIRCKRSTSWASSSERHEAARSRRKSSRVHSAAARPAAATTCRGERSSAHGRGGTSDEVDIASFDGCEASSGGGAESLFVAFADPVPWKSVRPTIVAAILLQAAARRRNLGTQQVGSTTERDDRRDQRPLSAAVTRALRCPRCDALVAAKWGRTTTVPCRRTASSYRQ